jgi:hypothetical protein
MRAEAAAGPGAAPPAAIDQYAAARGELHRDAEPAGGPRSEGETPGVGGGEGDALDDGQADDLALAVNLRRNGSSRRPAIPAPAAGCGRGGGRAP